MEIVSGRTGTPHVTSQQFRQIIEGTIGQGSCIITSGENLEPELASNNVLKIRSGMMSHHGNVSSVKIGTYDEVELLNGSQNMKRIDLVVNRYTRNDETEIEKNSWVCIAGTPASTNPIAPEYTEGNLQDGDLIDDCPVFEIHYDGLNVTEVKKLLSVAKNSPEIQSELAALNNSLTAAQNKITELNGNLTKAQNQIATLNNNLTKVQNQITTLSGKIPFSKCSIGRIVGVFHNSSYLHATKTLDKSFGSNAVILSSIHYVNGSALGAESYPTPSLAVNGNQLELWVSGAFVNGHVLEVYYMVME